MEFDWDTHRRLAEGSDNWPVTWSWDNQQFTAFGDGGGFGGSNSEGRVSLGVARVEGDARSYRGQNLWGGFEAPHASTFGGKSYGIISIDEILYMWVSPGSDAKGYTEARLFRSLDGGASWTSSYWAFRKEDQIVFPTMCQFGPGYQGSRDQYVYHYAIRLQDDSALKVQKPGQIDLFRVGLDRIMDLDAYEFWAGMDSDGNPLWSSDIEQRKPVFEDPNGVGWTVSASYNAGLQRYLLTTEHKESFQAHLGFFEAPEPWGPWSTVEYYFQWGSESRISDLRRTFFCNFSNKWSSADGRNFVLVFTGVGEGDSWNTIEGRFLIRSLETNTDKREGSD